MNYDTAYLFADGNNIVLELQNHELNTEPSCIVNEVGLPGRCFSSSLANFPISKSCHLVQRFQIVCMTPKVSKM